MAMSRARMSSSDVFPAEVWSPSESLMKKSAFQSAAAFVNTKPSRSASASTPYWAARAAANCFKRVVSADGGEAEAIVTTERHHVVIRRVDHDIASPGVAHRPDLNMAVVENELKRAWQ
jgi:hypothetical protein